MSSIDVNALVAELKATASGVAGTDVTSFRQFSDQQVQLIAAQARLVSDGIASGQLPPALQPFFIKGIQDALDNYAATINGIKAVGLEKIYNATAAVVGKAMTVAIGATPLGATGGMVLAGAVAITQALLTKPPATA